MDINDLERRASRAEPMRQLFKSMAATGMGMDGAITAVAATTTVGTAATTMDGGIIAIGGELHVKPKKREAAVVGGLRIYRRSEAEFVNPAASLFFHMAFIISSRWREVFGALSSKPTG